MRRSEFEARVARANADAETQHCARPGGRRHAAQRDYLLHMDAESRGDRSFDQIAVRLLQLYLYLRELLCGNFRFHRQHCTID